MPKVADTYLEARRQQVIDAAIKCFARKGLHDTTMKDIAQEAGVSYGIVYHYFRNKEDIINATWQESKKARAASFQKVKQSTAAEMLDQVLDMSLGRLDKPEVIREMRLRVQLFGEALLNPRFMKNVRETWDDTLAHLEEIIRYGQEQGEVDPTIDARALARFSLAIRDGIVLQKTLNPEVDVPKIVEASRTHRRTSAETR